MPGFLYHSMIRSNLHKEELFTSIVRSLITYNFNSKLNHLSQYILKALPDMYLLLKDSSHEVNLYELSKYYAKVSGFDEYINLKRDDDRRLLFQSALVILFYICNQREELECEKIDIFENVNECIEYYKNAEDFSTSDIDEDELKNLMYFSNFIRTILKLVPNITRKRSSIIKLATTIVQNVDVNYITGSGQSSATQRRVAIYHYETGSHRVKRPMRINEIVNGFLGSNITLPKSIKSTSNKSSDISNINQNNTIDLDDLTEFNLVEYRTNNNLISKLSNNSLYLCEDEFLNLREDNFDSEFIQKIESLDLDELLFKTKRNRYNNDDTIESINGINDDVTDIESKDYNNTDCILYNPIKVNTINSFTFSKVMTESINEFNFNKLIYLFELTLSKNCLFNCNYPHMIINNKKDYINIHLNNYERVPDIICSFKNMSTESINGYNIIRSKIRISTTVTMQLFNIIKNHSNLTINLNNNINYDEYQYVKLYMKIDQILYINNNTNIIESIQENHKISSYKFIKEI